jgi:restriction endonuclease Mrr
VVEDLREEALHATAHSMKDNIIFQNIPEQAEAQDENVKHTLLEFMNNELQIQPNDLQHITINKVHRMGSKGKYSRAIMSNVNDEGKSVIWKLSAPQGIS